MQRIKRILVVLLACAVMSMFATACSSNTSQEAADTGSSDKLSVVTTIFPVYDWVRNVAGTDNENIDITMLLNSGVDLHSFQPTAEDILKIAECDVFIYVGGESDEWVEDALKEATNKDMVVVNLMDVMGDKAKEEEVKEGMQEEEHEHDHDADEKGEEHDADHEEHDADAEGEDHDADEEGEEHEHEEGPELDEHIWLSLQNAEVLCGAAADALSEADPDNADTYKANADAYIAELQALDGEYKDAVDNAAVKTVLFGDRFPFRYMTDDYGLDYFAAFVGCSAETEASFETIAFLSNKVDELGLTHVMTIENNDHKIAESIINNTKNKDQKILTMDSLQSTTSEDVENGTTYLDVMRANLEVLKEALS